MDGRSRTVGVSCVRACMRVGAVDACPYAVAVVCMLCSGVECVRPAGVTARVWARMRSDCGRVADRTVGLCALSAVVCRQCCPPVEDVGMSGRSCPTGCPHAMWACGENWMAWMVPVGARGRGPACSRPYDAGGVAVSALVGAYGLKRETCCCSNDWPWAWQKASPGVMALSSSPGLADEMALWRGAWF